jgi:Cd2+/Zn2+-exporting ATPase
LDSFKIDEMREHDHQPENHQPVTPACHGEDCSVTAKPQQTISLNSAATAEQLTTLRVEGMDCADEVAALERVLKPVAGIREFKVNLMAGRVTIAHEKKLSTDNLIRAVGKAGLKARAIAEGQEEEASASAQRARLIAVIVSGVFTGIGLLMQWQNIAAPYGRIVAFVIAIIAGGWFILPKAFRAIRQRSLDMNVLMTVAVISAAIIGEWSEAAAVVFLFALSEALEAFSLNRARRAIQALLKLAPETALVKRGNEIKEVSVQEVNVGEIVSIRSGAKIPLDGEVTAGESAVNQAPITGESMPVEKKPGDEVFAGTINTEGSLEVRVTKPHSETTLSKIIHLVEEAQSEKAPSQRFVDRFARIYTPAVFVVAMLVLVIPPLAFNGDWNTWIYRSLVLLVIACPCALVISTPVSIVSGLTAMARRGVLIKGGTHLESIGKLRALAVDKTGTITEGNPKVTKVTPWNGKSEEEAVRIAASIDANSDHPLAEAVVNYAKEKNITFDGSEQYQSKTGRGAEARIGGHIYFVGNHRFAHELGVCSPELEKLLSDIEAQAQSVVVVGHKPHDGEKGDVLGVISVADTIRPNAKDAIAALHKAGVEKVVMLSGDNQRTVDAISKQVGIDEAIGGLLPDDKINRVKELAAKYKYVGMIGDGVNDAPAMAAATVGIAMGTTGTDTAIETADIALMKDDLSKVAEAVELGRRTMRVIQVNIAFALLVKAAFLVLAFTGHTSLWLAILADTGATLVVIANALRLLRHSNSPEAG